MCAPAQAKYTVMFYRSGHQAAIRQASGSKRQVASWGGKRCTWSEQRLRQLAEQVAEAVSSGAVAEEEAKDYGQKLMAE